MLYSPQNERQTDTDRQRELFDVMLGPQTVGKSSTPFSHEQRPYGLNNFDLLMKDQFVAGFEGEVCYMGDPEEVMADCKA